LAQNRKFQDFVENKYMADDAIGNSETDKNQSKMLCFDFDGSSLAVGAVTLTASDGITAQTIPAGAILKSWYIDVSQAFTSAGSATLALGITGTADALIGATAFNNAALVAATAGWEFASKGAKTDGAKSVIATIGTANLTAGRFKLYIEYVEEAL
tara:strand:- start:1475 stop:1942 length:468 start_codon:yes stop_codon:yes gene_type:complete